MERNQELDFLKGIGIVLVVVGHCIQYGMGFDWYTQERYFENTLFKIIYSFHMPLLMTVSGWIFCLSAGRYSLIQIMKKKIKRLIIPAVAWPMLMSQIEWMAGESNLRGGGQTIYTSDKKMSYRTLVFMGSIPLCADSASCRNIFKGKMEINVSGDT